MPAIIVVGAQWGDEGKGKIVDLLTTRCRHVVRAQGGNNAGHTLVAGKKEFKLHLVPSGILSSHVQCYLGAGTVIDPKLLLSEIEEIESHGIEVKNRLWISLAAHVIFPFHKTLDLLGDERKGEFKIGTTARGVGPCYADKANRIGLRMGDLIRPHVLKSALKNILRLKNEELEKIYRQPPCNEEEIVEEYLSYGSRLAPFVRYIENDLERAIRKGENMVFEAAQGTFLDVTLGTYPYVTSSNTTAGGVCSGAGIGPTRIDHTLGVVKAYSTRVGNGPMPTCLTEKELSISKLEAREFGMATKMKRRFGWFDVPLVKESIRLNGIDSIAITKLDVLDALDTIKICVAYELNGRRIESIPHVLEDFEKLKPIYETFSGWKTPLHGCSKFEDLPANAQHYLRSLESLCSTPISLISVGPERECTVMMRDLFS